MGIERRVEFAAALTLDWPRLGALTFERHDPVAFPCLALAYEAGREGGLAPAWLGSTDELSGNPRRSRPSTCCS